MDLDPSLLHDQNMETGTDLNGHSCGPIHVGSSSVKEDNMIEDNLVEGATCVNNHRQDDVENGGVVLASAQQIVSL